VGGDGSMQLTGNTNELHLKFDVAVPPPVIPANTKEVNSWNNWFSSQAVRMFRRFVRVDCSNDLFGFILPPCENWGVEE
jgi:hypothetical protein